MPFRQIGRRACGWGSLADHVWKCQVYISCCHLLHPSSFALIATHRGQGLLAKICFWFWTFSVWLYNQCWRMIMKRMCCACDGKHCSILRYLFRGGSWAVVKKRWSEGIVFQLVLSDTQNSCRVNRSNFCPISRARHMVDQQHLNTTVMCKRSLFLAPLRVKVTSNCCTAGFALLSAVSRPFPCHHSICRQVHHGQCTTSL